MGKNLEANFEKMNSSEQNLPRIYVQEILGLQLELLLGLLGE